MITFLSLVTSVKDYIEIAHKLIESSNTSQNIVSLKNYTELGAVITYVIISIKQLFLQFITLNWLQNVYSLPIMVPDIASAMLSEISVLDGFFHNAFTFLDTPLSYGNQNVTVYGFEKFVIGFINSFFLFLPTSTAHIITLRRFVMQGLEAGYIAGLGTIAGNILWLCSIIFGWRFFVIPWLSFDIFRYILGFMLLIKYMWDSSKERRMVVEDLSKYKIFMLNFLLALTEQTCIYPFINNLSIAPEASVLESFAASNLIQFVFIHSAYILGILVGSLSLLKFTCWFWENPAFNFYMWIVSAERSFFKQPLSSWDNKSGSGKKAQNNAIFGFNLQTSSYYKILNFIFMYLTMVCAISSFTYFGLDYTITNPLGFIPQDRVIDQKALNQNLSSAQSLNEKLIPETSFLSVNPTDKSRRTRDGVRARRERWKDPLLKYQVLDPSVQDQGVYNFLTIEDLNYGFDRFWLRRKMRNHKINFRLVPGPFMRSLKKQLNKNNLADPNNSKGVEFFRLLFEQYYHPSFHKSVVSSKLNNASSIKKKEKDIAPISNYTASKLYKEPSSPFISSFAQTKREEKGGRSLLPIPFSPSFSPEKYIGENKKVSLFYNSKPHQDAKGDSTKMPYKRDILYKDVYSNEPLRGEKQSALFLNFKLSRAEINQYSALRKFTRNMQTRINLSKIGKQAAFLPDGATLTNTAFNTQKNPFIYSKKWKSIFSCIWHNTKPSNNKSLTTTLDVPLFRNVFRKILSKKPFMPLGKDTAHMTRLSASAIEEKDFFLSPYIFSGERKEEVKQSKSTPQNNATIWQSAKKTMIREKLSKKDRQILRYRTLLLRHSLNPPIHHSGGIYHNKRGLSAFVPLVGVLPKKENQAPSFASSSFAFPSFYSGGNEKGKMGEGMGAEGGFALTKPSLQAQTMLHPLKFYLQKQQAFARKYKFYGTTVFRKLSVGNNAPYFKTMMKRFFYYYKPTLRWKRTINLASLGSGSQEGFRKKSRIAKKLFSLEKPLADSKASLPTFPLLLRAEEELSKAKLYTSNTSTPLVAIEKPTHSYSVLGKQASRYRYQIYRDVLQHWYYTPFNRLLLKFDIDAFMSRQPKSHFITKKEEHLLHMRRFLLCQHYDSVRWYTYMQHYSSMKNTIGGSKSFASKVYNQQFQGTFKKVRHLFAITPSQSFSYPPLFGFEKNEKHKQSLYSVKGEVRQYREGKANKGDITLDIQTKKTLRQLTPGLSQNKAVLKFDQPLFNEFSNTSKVSIVNSSVTHEELLKPFKAVPRPGLFGPPIITPPSSYIKGEKGGAENEDAIKEDFISQSSNLVGQSLTEALKEKKQAITKLVQDKNYWQFTQFLFKGHSGLNLELFNRERVNTSLTLSGDRALENKAPPFFNKVEKVFPILGEGEKTKNPLNSALKKNSANNSIQVMANSNSQELWVKLLKENKRRVYDREFLKNFITHRIDKKTQQIQEQQTLLKNRLLRLKIVLSPITLVNQKKEQTSKVSIKDKISFPSLGEALDSLETQTNNYVGHFLKEQDPTHAKAYPTTGVQKALKDSFLLLSTPTENIRDFPLHTNSASSSFSPLIFSPFKGRKKDREKGSKTNTIEEVLVLNLKVQQNMLGSLRQIKTLLAQNHYRLNKNSVTVGLPDIVTKLNPLRRSIATKIQKLARFLMTPSADKNVAWWRKKQQAMTKRKTSRKKNRFKKLNKKKEAFKFNLSIPRLASSVVPAKNFKGSTDTELLSTPLMVKRFKKDRFNRGNALPSSSNLGKENTFSDGVVEARVQKNMGLFKDALFSKVYNFSSLEKGIWHRFLTKQFSKKKSNNLRRYKVYPKATGYGGIKKPKYLNKDSSTKEEKQNFLYSAYESPLVPLSSERATKLWTNPLTGTPFYSNRASLKGLEGSIRKTRIKKRLQRRKTYKEKSSQKIYKYKRRKIQSAGKLRVLSKKLKTMKANLQLQTWWWQHFLPSYQAAIDAPWQVEKNRELQKIVSTLATTQITKDIQHSGNVTGLNVQDLKNYVLKNKSYKPLWFQSKHKTKFLEPLNYNTPSKSVKQLESNSSPTGESNNLKERAYITSLEKLDKTKQNILTCIYENLYKQHLNQIAKGNAIVSGVLPEKKAGFTKGNATLLPQGNTLDFKELKNIWGKGEVNTVFKGYKPLNPLPFYAGWDESLRKFVVTNRFLSRRQAGFNFYSNHTKSTQAIQFRKAPIGGLNEGSSIYNKTDILFNTYAIEQFNGVSQSFYAPLGWRRFQFRHSILKRWFTNLVKLDTQQSKPLKPTSNITWLVKNKALPSSVPSRLWTELRKSREANTQKIKLKKNLNRRTKKRYKILKDRQEELYYQPTGSLLTEVLPSHYFSIFDNQYRLPTSRYLRMPFIEFSKDSPIALNGAEQTKEQTNEPLRSSTFMAENNRALSPNKAAILYNNFQNRGNSPDFTLRKRIKTKRKYHRKRNMPRGGLIFPRRRKFIAPLSDAFIPAIPSWRPSSFRKASSATSSKAEKSKQKKRVKTNPSRLRQLRRRELQQVVKPNQRYQPRYGGFVWPGDYLRLEFTDYPKLLDASLPSIEGKKKKDRSTPDLVLSSSSYNSKVTSASNIGDIALPSIKNTAKVKLPTSLVGVLPRKYLLQKHNIKVLKKKLEKAQRSHKIHERTKQLKFYLSKNTTN